MIKLNEIENNEVPARILKNFNTSKIQEINVDLVIFHKSGRKTISQMKRIDYYYRDEHIYFEYDKKEKIENWLKLKSKIYEKVNKKLYSVYESEGML